MLHEGDKSMLNKIFKYIFNLKTCMLCNNLICCCIVFKCPCGKNIDYCFEQNCSSLKNNDNSSS